MADILRLDASWIYKVSVLSDLVSRRVAHVVGKVSGLNLSQWRVLAAIADLPGRTASEVVAVTPMDKGIVSRAVATLVERGLATRKASNSDGRLSHLHLTAKGRSTYARIMAALRESGTTGDELLGARDADRLLDQLDAAIAAYRELPPAG